MAGTDLRLSTWSPICQMGLTSVAKSPNPPCFACHDLASSRIVSASACALICKKCMSSHAARQYHPASTGGHRCIGCRCSFVTRDFRPYRLQALPEGPPWLWLSQQILGIKKPRIPGLLPNQLTICLMARTAKPRSLIPSQSKLPRSLP